MHLNNMKQIWKDISLTLTTKEKQRFIKLVLLDVIVSVLDISFIVLLLFIIQFYSATGHAGKYSGWYIHLFGNAPLLPVFIFFLLFSVKNIFAFMVFRGQYRFIYEVASRISKNRLLHYMEGSYTDYVQTDSAVHMRSISQQPLEFCNYILRGVQQVISQVILIALSVIPIVIYNATLFPLLLLILVPPVILAGFIMKRKTKAVRSSVKATGEQAWQHLKESLAGFVESNVHGKNRFFLDRYHRFQSRQNHFLAEQQTIQNLPPRLIEVFAVFGLFILIGINTRQTNTTVVNIVTIGAFLAAAYKIIPGIVKIMNSIGQIKMYAFAVSGLAQEKKTAAMNQPAGAGIASIQFDHVFFYYGPEIVLDDFSLEINAGDFAGIAGVSGKGKSTLINLLLGFLVPAKGNIIINGVVINEANHRRYWSSISYVKQQSFLIHDSILKNITLQEDGYDATKLEEVIRLTGVDDLISKSEKGIHTMITEEGKNFSGGQRQRIILARALYKGFDTLILDEPFNELDEAAETALLCQLKKITAAGKTVILITHNKEGLSFCNKQILLA